MVADDFHAFNRLHNQIPPLSNALHRPTVRTQLQIRSAIQLLCIKCRSGLLPVKLDIDWTIRTKGDKAETVFQRRPQDGSPRVVSLSVTYYTSRSLIPLMRSLLTNRIVSRSKSSRNHPRRSFLYIGRLASAGKISPPRLVKKCGNSTLAQEFCSPQRTQILEYHRNRDRRYDFKWKLVSSEITEMIPAGCTL